jgi:hypothetical protein
MNQNNKAPLRESLKRIIAARQFLISSMIYGGVSEHLLPHELNELKSLENGLGKIERRIENFLYPESE